MTRIRRRGGEAVKGGGRVLGSGKKLGRLLKKKAGEGEKQYWIVGKCRPHLEW